MSRPVYAPQGAQEARGTGYAVRGFPSTLLPKSLPGASMRCTCRRCVVTGLRQASLRHMAAGGTRFKSSSRGLPPRSPDSTPVCAISLSSISSSGLPEAPLESRSWLPRSVITATFDGPLPAEPVLTAPQDGDTPVIVLTRACGRVAPVTRGSDALARVFPDGARTRRTELFSAAFPRRTVWDTVGGPSAAPHRISRILSGTDVESVPPFI